MPPLNVQLAFRSQEFQNDLDLPVEVRKPNMSLVAAGLSNEIFQIEKGDYYVIGRLPAGQQLISRVSVGDNGATTILRPRPEEQSPHESHEHVHFLIEAYFDALAPAIPISWQFTRTDYVSWSAPGNPILPTPEPVGDFMQYEISGADHLSYVRVSSSQPPSRVAIVAVAASGGQTMRLLLPKAITEAMAAPEVRLQNSQANLLLANIKSGSLDQANIASLSSKVSAEALLQNKLQDPFAACVGAYALLMFGDLERLRDWTKNLQDWFPWLPDGLCIRGEHLARMGRHTEALESFSQLPARGIPVFSFGITTALNRLHLYKAWWEKKMPVDAIDKAIEALTPVGNLLNSSSPVTTLVEQSLVNVANVALATV
jgi:hypothetical protein